MAACGAGAEAAQAAEAHGEGLCSRADPARGTIGAPRGGPESGFGPG